MGRAGRQMGVGDEHQPGSSGRPVWACGPAGGLAEGLFAEAEGVLEVEAADVRAPASVQVRAAGAGSPQPKRLDCRAVGRDRCSTSTRITVPITIGAWVQSLQRPRLTRLGGSPAQAATATRLYGSPSAGSVWSGAGHLVGSAPRKRALCRAGALIAREPVQERCRRPVRTGCAPGSPPADRPGRR
jgi:hypothetical protein